MTVELYFQNLECAGAKYGPRKSLGKDNKLMAVGCEVYLNKWKRYKSKIARQDSIVFAAS